MSRTAALTLALAAMVAAGCGGDAGDSPTPVAATGSEAATVESTVAATPRATSPPTPTALRTPEPTPTVVVTPTPLPTPTPTAAVEPSPTAEPAPATPTVVEATSTGIGPAEIGEEADTAVPKLVATFGEPTSDMAVTGVRPFLFGPPDEVITARLIDWPGLRVGFIDTALFRPDSVLHLFGWSISGPTEPPVTDPAGVAVGATLADVEAAYPDVAVVLSGCTRIWSAVLGPVAWIEGTDSAVVVEFGDLAVPDPFPSRPTTVAPPPDAAGSIVTAMRTNKMGSC